MKSRNLRLAALLLCLVMCMGILAGCGAETTQLDHEHPPLAAGDGLLENDPNKDNYELGVWLHVINGSFPGQYKNQASVWVNFDEGTRHLPASAYGEEIKPTRSHGTFAGWYTASPSEKLESMEGGKYSVRSTVSINGDKIEAGGEVPQGIQVLYAAFDNNSTVLESEKLVTYKLNYNGAQGKNGALECTRTYGSLFDADNAIVTGLNVTGTWAEFEAAVGDKSQASLTKYWNENPLNGYTFLGWYDAPVGGNMISIGAVIGEAIKDGQTLYAHYTYNGASSDDTVGAATPGPLTELHIASELEMTAHADGEAVTIRLSATPQGAALNNLIWNIKVDGGSRTYTQKTGPSLLSFGITVSSSSKDGTLTIQCDDDREHDVTVTAQADGAGTRETVTIHFAHSWEKYDGYDPTCTKSGRVYYRCQCGKTMERVISATGHNWSTTTKHTDCLTDTVTETCANCGKTKSYTVEANNPDLHKWSEWTVTAQATTIAVGSEKRTCSVCHKVETKEIPKIAFKLDAPEISTVENTTKGVEVTWDEVDGAEKYRVYGKSGSGDWTTLANTTETSYTWTGAKSGTTYTFRVRCVNNAASVVTSDHDEDKSITYIAPPKDVKVSSEANGIKVTWTKSAGAAKYRVFYKPNGGSWAKAADTTETSYLWTGAKKDTTYQIRVWCVSADGKTQTSGHDNIPTITYTPGSTATPKPTAKPTAAPTAKPTVKPTAAPTAKPTEKPTAAPTAKPTEKPTEKPSGYELSAPTGVKAENAAKGIKVTWTKVTGAVKYRVFYKPEGGSWAKAGDTTSTSYTWTKAKSGTTYQIRVRCITGDGKTGTSDFSASKSLKYIAAPEYTLTSESKGIKVSWKKVTGAEKYRIYYKTAGGSWKTLVNTDETSYTWTGAKSGTKYTFRVRCVDSTEKKVTSYYGTDKSITYTKPASYQLSAPKIKTVSSVSNGIKVTWGKVTGAVKYRVFYKPEGGSWTKAGDTTSTSFTWKGAKSGTTYQIRVRCISADGKTGTSDFSAVKTIAYKK